MNTKEQIVECRSSHLVLYVMARRPLLTGLEINCNLQIAGAFRRFSIVIVQKYSTTITSSATEAP